MITAQQTFKAYQAMIANRAGKRVVKINTCPDCKGLGRVDGHDCYTCGNEPDDARLVKKGNSWYRSDSL